MHCVCIADAKFVTTVGMACKAGTQGAQRDAGQGPAVTCNTSQNSEVAEPISIDKQIRT